MAILVVDDNVINLELLTDVLEGNGYEVITAADGPTALRITGDIFPDLIILDVNMPGMSGFDVVARLKDDDATNHIPVMMLTAMADVDNRVTGLGLGAEDYLTKPFNARELVARVETRLRAKQETDSLRATQELVRSTFERFVAASVVDQLLENPLQVKLGGRLQDVTVFFADLENFTSLSEHTEPEVLLSLLNEYHALIVGLIQAHGGTVDKFLGDGVMALYNTPLAQEDHAMRAIRSAMAIRSALPEFYENFDTKFQLGVHFGIHSGPAIVGNVGTQEIMDFTAVGDTVNLASRLQGISGGNQVVISQATYDAVRGKIVVEELGDVTVRGRTGVVRVYEVVELLKFE